MLLKIIINIVFILYLSIIIILIRYKSNNIIFNKKIFSKKISKKIFLNFIFVFHRTFYNTINSINYIITTNCSLFPLYQNLVGLSLIHYQLYKNIL